MTGPGPSPVQPGEIADLLAWARALTRPGHHASPAEQAAYLAAKADLLERIAARRASQPAAAWAEDAGQVAAAARAAARQAAAAAAITPEEP